MTRKSVKELQKMAGDISAKTKARAAENRKRRVQKKVVAAKAKDKGLPDFSSPAIRDEKVYTSSDVKRWFRKGFEDYIEDSVALPSDRHWWGVDELNCAKLLLEAYEPDVVETGIDYFFQYWDPIVEGSDGVLSGFPNVKLLWKMRGIIFPNATSGKPYEPFRKRPKREHREIGEWVDVEGVDVGWGDE